MDPSNLALIWHMFIASAMGVALLQYLKKAQWFKWAQVVGTRTANRVISIVIALCGATGVGHVWDPHAHTLLLTNLSLLGIVTALWHWLQQFVLQETIYQATANKNGYPAQIGVTGTIIGKKP